MTDMSERVLIVDDNESVREVFRSHLAEVGFAVDDIQAVRTELLRRGVEPIGDIVDDEAGSPWAYFRDPEGNVFEIKQRAPKEDRANEGGVHP